MSDDAANSLHMWGGVGSLISDKPRLSFHGTLRMHVSGRSCCPDARAAEEFDVQRTASEQQKSGAVHVVTFAEGANRLRTGDWK